MQSTSISRLVVVGSSDPTDSCQQNGGCHVNHQRKERAVGAVSCAWQSSRQCQSVGAAGVSGAGGEASGVPGIAVRHAAGQSFSASAATAPRRPGADEQTRPGRSHASGGRCEEGYRIEYQRWEHTGEGIEYHWATEARDCDGRFDQGGESFAPLDQLAVRPAYDQPEILGPEWKSLDTHQRDYES